MDPSLDGHVLVSPRVAHAIVGVLNRALREADRGRTAVDGDVRLFVRAVQRADERYRAEILEASDVSDGYVMTSSSDPGAGEMIDVEAVVELVGRLAPGREITGHGVRQAARCGRLTGRKAAGRWFFDEVDVLEWLGAHR